MSNGFCPSLEPENASGVSLADGISASSLQYAPTKEVTSSFPAATKSHPRSLPLKSLNHVSIHCHDVGESLRFYCDLMGFVPVKRPTCLDYFDGAWLFNYGIGIHLLKDDSPADKKRGPTAINPRSDHVSFQCEDIEAVESLLKERGVPYVRQQVVEHGIVVDQLFFHDPDDHMIEICNCEALPVEPLTTACAMQFPEHIPPLHSSKSSPGVSSSAVACAGVGSCGLRRASVSLPGSPAKGLAVYATVSEVGSVSALEDEQGRVFMDDDAVKRQDESDCSLNCTGEREKAQHRELLGIYRAGQALLSINGEDTDGEDDGGPEYHFHSQLGKSTLARVLVEPIHPVLHAQATSPTSARRSTSGTSSMEMNSFMSFPQVPGLC